MIAAARYGDLIALLKTRMGGLYPPGFYATLATAPHAADVANHLQAAGVPLPPGGKLPTRQWLLAHWLVPDYRSVCSRLTGTARDVVRAWFARLEVENVKYLLRALVAGQALRKDHLIDAGELAVLPLDAMAQISAPEALAAALQGTVFEQPLRASLQRIHEQDGLFLTETALDRAMYGSLTANARRYHGPGAAPLLRVTARVVNGLTVLWVARYRLDYGLPAEAATGLALASPSPQLVQFAQQTGQMEQSADLGKIWPSVFPMEGERAPGEETLIGWEHRFRQELLHMAHALVLGSPFGLSVIMGLLLLKELALHDLAVICQGHAYGLSSTDIKALLIHV